MKFANLFIISSVFLGSGCAGISRSSTIGTGFRHPVLWSVGQKSHHVDLVSTRSVLAQPTEHLEQRCTEVFRHPVLNRCQSWIPSRIIPHTALAGCHLKDGCRLAFAETTRNLMVHPRYHFGKTSFRKDCSGFVFSALRSAGVKVSSYLPKRNPGEGGVSLLYRLAKERGLLHKHKVPDIGDLVFFDNTHDRNGNGKMDDPLTHVGIVEKVDPDGTVTFIHKVRRGILRYKLNLFHPHLRRDPKTGKVFNHYIRRGTGDTGLTGELFAAFASVLPK